MNKIDRTYIEFHPDSWEQAKNVASNYSEWIFRGQNKAIYGLETSIQRAARIYGVDSKDIEDYEKSILRSFQRQAHHFLSITPNDNEVLEWLSIIQHYGGPTRLLDFTYSFYIACHFAMQDAEEEAAIWCVNRNKLEHCVETRMSRRKGTLDSNTSDIFYRAILGNLKDVMAKPVEPFHKNMRLAIQQGLFVFPFNIAESFENNLFSTMSSTVAKSEVPIIEYERAHMELGTFPIKGRLLKICLKKECHHDVRKDLLRMNISPASLFPGLDGFAKSLALCAY